jgi:Phage portal protein, SPP1 Gp6-like
VTLKITDRWNKNRLLNSTEKYIKGTFNVPYLDSLQANDRERAYILSDMAKTVCDTHVDFALDDFTSLTEDKPFLLWSTDSNLGQKNREHYFNALAYGQSVELYSVAASVLQVTAYEPMAWALEYSNGQLISAIYREVQNEITTYYEYTATQFIKHREVEKVFLATIADHHFGTVPVIVFRLNKSSETIISKVVRGFIDSHSVCLSSMEDVVKGDVSPPLSTSGVDWKKLLEKDAKGECLWDIMKQKGLFPLGEGATAEYLNKTVNADILALAIDRIEARINISCKTPVITSGDSTTQLRLAYAPLIGATKSHLQYFEDCLTKRLGFYNRLQAILANAPPLIVRYKANLQVLHNNLEYLQALPALAEVFSFEQLIDILPFVDAERMKNLKPINIKEE